MSKQVTNEEKAREIAYEYFRRGQLGLAPISTENAGYESALKAMQWKDAQHAQEKQKLIDEACNWLNKNDSYAIPTNVQVDRLREYLNDIK